ncbi:hypothetical protein [Candidatus Nitrososphaera sp. FF02]|uniref:hypothetical protein n=1 Tax=Candidatus Nitrososphaera sp. FF02 TaxID=3398226 RepID=UPI0039E9CF1C
MNKKILAIAFAAILGASVVTVAGFAFTSGPRPPNVKFVEFTPQGTTTLRQGESVTVSFNVKNFDSTTVTNARIVTELEGAQFFTVDKPDYVINEAIAGPDGQSSEQTIVITSLNTGDLSAIESAVGVGLIVDDKLVDLRQFDLRIEK